MVGRDRFAWVVVAAIGCGSNSEILPVELPAPSGPTESFVLLIDQQFVYAGAIDDSLRLDQPTASALELAYYPAGLEDLGLPSGLVSGRGDQCRSCALAEPPETFVSAGFGATWSRGSVSAAFVDAVVPDAYLRCACDELEREFVPIPVPKNITVVGTLAEKSGSVLIVVSEGSLVRIHEDLTVERLCTVDSPLEAAGLAEDGLWLASGNKLMRAEVSAPASGACTVTASTAGLGPFDEIDADVTQVVGVSNTGIVSRFDGTRMQALTDAEEGLGPGKSHILALSPELVVASRRADALVVVRSGVVDTEIPRRGSNVEGIARFRDGLVVSVPSGLAMRTDAGWAIKEYQSGWVGASSLIPFRGGLVATGNAGSFLQVNSRLELCPEQPGFSQEKVYEGAPLGERGLVLGDVRTGDFATSGVGVVRAKRQCG